MKTPSLRGRVVVAGVGVVVLVLMSLDVFLYFSLRRRLLHNLDELLATRVDVVRAEGEALQPQPLAARLAQLGVWARVWGPDGYVFESSPVSPALGTGLPPAMEADDRVVYRQVQLPRGVTAIVFARRSGVDKALFELIVFEVAGTSLALGLATFLLLRVSKRALQPVDEIAAAARRTTAGSRGERLRPNRPETNLGQLAVAYDQMLDSLELALTEAREAESHSRRLEERSRQILDTAADAFIAMDEAGSIIDWNPQAERTFGRTREEVLGRPLDETIIPAARRAAHREGVQRFLSGGDPRILGRWVRFPALHADGRTFPVEMMTWTTVDDGRHVFNAFVHDVTARQEAEDAISRLAALVESADVTIIGKGLDGRILSWNRGAERISGYNATELVGQHISVIVPPERQEELERLLDQVRRGESVHQYQTNWVTKSGTVIDVEMNISPIRDPGGAVVGTSTIARDVTQERWMAATLDATLADREKALDHARQSEARSRRFLADAAHQLRTPIAGIRACAETLLRGTAPVEGDALLADLVREAARASRLMAGLLKMAQLDQGQPLSLSRCDLLALCAEEADRARFVAPGLEIVVTGSLLGEQPQIDANAVREMLANLLDNARRHAVSRVEVNVAKIGEELEVQVCDDGPGLPEELWERAFERFVTIDGRGGSGLGLPIARSLARAHGGDLVYEDRRFVVRLPSSPS